MTNEAPSQWKPIRELRPLAYPPEKAIAERLNNPGSYLLYRRLSWPITYLAVGLQVHPLAITSIALLIAGAGLVMIISANFVAGAILLNASMVMDQVDGNVARATKRASSRGARLDSLVGLLYTSLPPWATGLAILYSPTEQIFGSLSGATTAAITFSGTVAIILRKLVVQIAPVSPQRASRDRAAWPNPFSSSGVVYGAKIINSFGLFFLLISAVAGVAYEFMFAYSVYQAALFLVVVSHIMRPARNTPETGSFDIG